MISEKFREQFVTHDSMQFFSSALCVFHILWVCVLYVFFFSLLFLSLYLGFFCLWVFIIVAYCVSARCRSLYYNRTFMESNGIYNIQLLVWPSVFTYLKSQKKTPNSNNKSNNSKDDDDEDDDDDSTELSDINNEITVTIPFKPDNKEKMCSVKKPPSALMSFIQTDWLNQYPTYKLYVHVYMYIHEYEWQAPFLIIQ